MRLLTLCFPTFGQDNHLHLTSDGRSVVLAPDEFHAGLLQAGWEVDVVSLAPPTDKCLFRSRLPLLPIKGIAGRNYNLVWHMFRDPTQPEVLAALVALGSSLPRGIPTVNDAARLVRHNKFHYLPLLDRYGLAVPLVDTQPPGAEWLLTSGTYVDRERGLISTHAYNNNRGDYRERGHGRVTLRYIDNAVEGRRSIVRFGMAFGQGFCGCEYFSTQYAFRSGEAEEMRPYCVPLEFQEPLRQALAEIGCDVCHVEAVPHAGRLYVFDINPYPTANGRTLSDITRALVPILSARAFSNRLFIDRE